MEPISLDDLFWDFPSGGFTAIPHDLLDWLAPRLSEAELRVLLYICRRTYGFRKQSDKISLNQFCDRPTSRSGQALDLGTGLSRQGVLNGLAGLKLKGVIKMVPGRGRAQVSQYEVLLSDEARARVIQLQMTPREMVNSVDYLRRPVRDCVSGRADGGRSRKGQPPKRQKVNVPEKTPPKTVYAVDPQEKGNMQEKGLKQEKAGFARNGLFSPEPPTEEYLGERLERITGQRLANRERAKLQTLDPDPERIAVALDTFSTETYWIDVPNRNSLFFDYFKRIAVERSSETWTRPSATKPSRSGVPYRYRNGPAETRNSDLGTSGLP